MSQTSPRFPLLEAFHIWEKELDVPFQLWNTKISKSSDCAITSSNKSLSAHKVA